MMDFKEIINRVKLITGSTQKEIAADLFEISDKNLSNKIKRGSIDIDALIKWAGNASVDLNWLLTGNGTPYINMNDIDGRTSSENSNLVESDHFDIFRRFVDKPFAIDLNLDLVELERMSPAAYRKVGAYIKGVVDGVRMEAAAREGYFGPERRHAERRISSDPNQAPYGKDRRCGKDRRKTSGAP